MTSQETSPKNWFLSLRWKLLFAYTLIFSGVFSAAFYWFYQFSSAKALARIRADMEDTLVGTVEGVDVEELLSLYETGEPNAEGFSDDPRYRNQLHWFEMVNSVEPRAWLYTYLVRDVEPTEDNPEGKEVVYLVDLWATSSDTSKAAQFLETEPCPCPQTLEMMGNGLSQIDEDIYTDQFGRWLSAYAPLRNEQGTVVAILGLDFEAAYVAQVQAAIRARILISFAVTYATLFGLVFLVSGALTKHLNELKVAAELVGEGNYDQDFDAIGESRIPDEITTLGNVFSLMVGKIKGREERLKQQVLNLQIEIDEAKRKKQVKEITETDFFQDLQSKAKRIRDRPKLNE